MRFGGWHCVKRVVARRDRSSGHKRDSVAFVWSNGHARHRNRSLEPTAQGRLAIRTACRQVELPAGLPHNLGLSALQFRRLDPWHGQPARALKRCNHSPAKVGRHRRRITVHSDTTFDKAQKARLLGSEPTDLRSHRNVITCG